MRPARSCPAAQLSPFGTRLASRFPRRTTRHTQASAEDLSVGDEVLQHVFGYLDEIHHQDNSTIHGKSQGAISDADARLCLALMQRPRLIPKIEPEHSDKGSMKVRVWVGGRCIGSSNLQGVPRH